MSSDLLKKYIKEALVLDAGAAGSAALDIPDGVIDVNIMDIAMEELASNGPSSTRMQQILAFNEMVFNISIEGGNKNAWQAIAEKMLRYWGYEVEDQTGDSAGEGGVTVFYDAVKGGTYYSVKSSFKPAAKNFAVATQSSSPKIESILALIIKNPGASSLGNIGCVCTKDPANPVIRWGHVSSPISRLEVANNIDTFLPVELSDEFMEAIATPPSGKAADILVKKIKAFFLSPEGLGMKDGRLNTGNMTKILGPLTQEPIGSLTLVEPEELFSKTIGSSIKSGKRSDGTEVASKEDRDDFMRRMRSVSRTLSSSEMEEIISTALSIMSSSNNQVAIESFTPPTQKYLREYFALRDYVSNILKEELTKSDKKEIDKLIKKAIEKDRAEQKKLIRKEIEDELVKSLGKSFFRQPGRIRKTIIDVCQEELAKEMQKGSKMEKSVVDVTKKVMSAWHEMLYKQKHIVDRIKV